MSAESRGALPLLIVGGGAVVSELYLPALARLGWIDACWVADPSVEALARLSADWPRLRTMPGDYRAALERGQAIGIRAVVVALPNGLHEAAVADALERGYDVLCEKPLALSQPACVRLGVLAEQAGRTLAVGMTRRFAPAVEAMRAAIQAGWIGEIQSVRIVDGYKFAWPTESGGYFKSENGGVLANLAVHSLDQLEYLCGPAEPVAYDDDWRGGVEANAHFVLRTAAGARVDATYSYTHPLAGGFWIQGTGGDVWTAGQEPGASYQQRGSRLVASLSAKPAFMSGDWADTFVSAFCDEFVDFRDAIADKRPPRATAADAARTAGLIDWAYAHHGPPAVESPVAVTSSVPALTPGRIVVTGGTGFVGGYLLDALVGKGHRDLRVLVRSYRSGSNAGRFPVQFDRVSLLDRQALRQSMDGARYVFHLAFGRDGEEADRVTVEGTQHVVEAAIDAGVECVVVVSSTSVFGLEGGDRPLDEHAPYRPPGVYEKLKTEAERWTLDRARALQGRTRIVVVNPACVYGPGGSTFTELPARLLRDGQYCWIDGGQGVVNYVFGPSLAAGLVAAAAVPTVHGERFIVSDGWTTWREFYTELFGDRVAGLPSFAAAELSRQAAAAAPTFGHLVRAVVGNPDVWRIVRENPRLAKSKALIGRLAPSVYGTVKRTRDDASAPPAPNGNGLPPAYLGYLFGPSTTRVSADKARRVLGWAPAATLAEGQAASRAWLAGIGLIADETTS